MPTIAPGENWVTKVAAESDGAVFGIIGGTHLGCVNCIPKPGMQFIADTPWRPGGTGHPILDGQTTAAYAIRNATSGAQPGDVVIKGLEARNYNPASQMGVIKLGGHNSNEGMDNTILENCYIHDSPNGGIRFGHRTKVLGCRVERMGQIGMVGLGNDLLIDGAMTYGVYRWTELINNNPTSTNIGFETGGCKFVGVGTDSVRVSGIICRHVRARLNKGNGIWMDVACDNYVVEDCETIDNLQNGVSTETSYSGIFRRIYSARNGLESPPTTWPALAGLGVHHSGGVGLEVYDNFLWGNAFGFGWIQQERTGSPGGEPLGPYHLKNVYTHDNIVVLQTGHPTGNSVRAASVNQDVGDNTIFTDRNLRFERNRYFVPASITTPFDWLNSPRAFAAWKDTYGNDVQGTFNSPAMLAGFRPGDL
jgi:hypothetical protein